MPVYNSLICCRSRAWISSRLTWDGSPCLGIALDAAREGGEMPADCLNAANEVAVQAFLDGRLNFGGIARVIGVVMNSWNNAGGECSLGSVLEADARARIAAEAIIARPASQAALRLGALN